LAMHAFWKTWDNVETRRQRRENPTLERDGWRCTAPACRAVGTERLQEHHVVFRSAGGGDDLSNRATLCVATTWGCFMPGGSAARGGRPTI
ncbi:MAG TPA: hypothetical protein VE404_09415, partial [Verrucomicrobiae bacterium]|nr:hypothetical protein [Verrucomicrobiae bacterium]